MKTRVAWKMWKMWKKYDFSPRYVKAMRTIETRTRRYYNKQAKKALKNGSTVMYNFYIHMAEWPFLMEDILFKDEGREIRAGKSYRIW